MQPTKGYPNPHWSNFLLPFKQAERRMGLSHTVIRIPTTCWIHYVGQQLRRQPEGGCNSSHNSGSWLHASPRAWFKIHGLTILYQLPLFPRIGYCKGNSTPGTAPPDFLQYPHLFGCACTDTGLCSDGCAVLSRWRTTAVCAHALNCLQHQRFMKLCCTLK